jgi:hypothetical protein
MQPSGKYIRFLLLLSMIFLSASGVVAQTIEQPVISVLNGAKGQIAHDSSAMVEDAKWWSPGDKAKLNLSGLYRIKNIITLKLNEDTAAYLKPQFNVTVKFKLFVTRSDGAIDSSLTPYLIIGYDTLTGSTYQSQSVFTFYDAYRVTAKVISVDSSYNLSFHGAAPPVTPFVSLQNEMQIVREYIYECDKATNLSLSVDTSNLASNGEITASWPTAGGATEYDVEWTYIDKEALLDTPLYTTAGAYDYKKIFTDNASLVTVTSTSYSIPMLYDNEGTLFVRFRPVQNKPSGQRWEGIWSSENPTGTGVGSYANFKGHESALNWQATTSFAEEGKRKSVVQYFDGSLRSRQTVTKDNTTNTTVVAETLYDFQGRPAIQVLPAPTLSNLIGYAKNFNRGLSGAYEKNLYDTLLSASDYCQTSAPQMKTDSGAAKYYSSANVESAIGFNKYIPDASGYAFTETRYTQDNTGRVLSQSGVGPNHLIGSGHEIKYYYGNPDQQELDGLFGTEAGYASHYNKNMVRDANGQFSVSYVDMHGRTVATALAGTAPTGMDTLVSNIKRTITEKISDSTNNINHDLVLESSRSLLVSDSGAYAFTYSLSPDSIRLQTCSASNICYDCLYNLEITITDECNNCHLPLNQPYVVVDSNFTFASIDTVCNAITGFNRSFTVGLPAGNYTVTKKLSISKFGYEYYRDSVFMKKNTCKTFADFYKEVSDTIRSQMNCGQTSCDSCEARTATLSAFRFYYLTNAGIPLSDSVQYRDDIALAYTKAIEECNFICGNIGQNTFIRKAMLFDMTVPAGQYANPDSAFNANRLYNIFNADNLIWNSSLVTYHDEYGKPDSIINSLGTLVPPNDPTITQGEYINNFKNSWTNDLLPFHPEYPKLVEYEKHIASNLWDEKFGRVDTYHQADSIGYMNPAGLNGSQVIDCNFIPSSFDPLSQPDSLLSGIIQDSFYYFRTEGSKVLSMWGVACVAARCPDNNTCGSRYTNDSLINCFNQTFFCTGELDMGWRTLRQLYLTKKRALFMHQLHIQNPLIHANIPAYRFEHFAESNDAIDAYIESINGDDRSTILADANGQLNQFYQSNCEAYASSWWTNLAPCNLTTADSTRLIPRMVEICAAGSDSKHPFGSSSTAPGSTLTYKSFEALVKHYIDSMHVIDPVQYNYNVACNADAIYAPMPYNQQQAFSEIPIWTKPDSCQCSVISTFYNQYLQYGSADTSFAAYIRRVTGTVITDDNLVKLRDMCSGVDTCKFLVSPIYLPPALQCGISDVCITCAQAHTAYESFKIVYPGVLPSYNANDSIQEQINRTFANYMNRYLGFSKQAVDYLEFFDSCSLGFNTDDTIHVPHLDASGCDTTIWKINLGGWHHTPTFRLADYISNSVLKMPEYDTANAGSGYIKTEFNYVDTLCLNNYFIYESRNRFPTNTIHENKYYSQTSDTSMYGTYAHEFHFDNNMMAIVWLARGKWAHASHIDSIYSYTEIFENGIRTVSHRDISTGLKYLSAWNILKSEFKNGKLRTYLNGQLLDTASYSTPFTKMYELAFDPYGYDLETDWVKMYDTTGNVRYFEDFNGCGQFAVQNLPHCSGAVVCDNLNQLLTNYQQSLLNAHTPHYDAGGCDTSMIKVNTGDSSHHSVTAHLSDWMENGILKVPWNDSSRQASSPNYFFEDSICTNNHFAFETRMRSPYSVGGEARYISLGRPMYYPSFYGYVANQVRFDNGTKVISGTFFRGKSCPGVMRDSIFLSVQSIDNGSFSSEVIHSTGLKYFGDWVNLKFQTNNNKVYIILNGSTIDSVTFSTNVTQFNRFGSITYGFDLQTDWWKMYDQNNRLRYFEDFNGCDRLANQTMPSCAEDCQQGFTAYFNSQRGTSYTYSQIDSLYYASCGTHPDPCYVSPVDCNQLGSSIKEFYTSKNTISHDSIGVEHGVWEYEQNTAATCDFSTVQLRNRFSYGIFEGYPFTDSCGSNYKINYVIPVCIGNHFSIAGRLRMYDPNPLLSRVNATTDINLEFDNSKYLTVRFRESYAGTPTFDIITESGTITSLYPVVHNFNSFSTWLNVKLDLRNDSLIISLDSTGTGYVELLRVRYTGNFSKLNKFGFGCTGYPVQMDWVKIYDASNTLQYTEDFIDNTNFVKVPNAFICSPTNCTTDYTSFYNTRFGTSLSYPQIAKLLQACGIYVQPCGLNTTRLLCGKTDPLFPPVIITEKDPCSDSTSLTFVKATELYKAYRDSLKNSFDAAYLARCKQAFKTESLTVSHPQREYHYTLYYYDQAGNLIKTVPPEGVDLVPSSRSTWLDSVAIARQNGTTLTPSHGLKTNYRYNTLNQVVAQSTPDAGLSSFWYDRLGRLVVSQNAKQKAASTTESGRQYSYTKYDVLGRISEVGQLSNATSTALTQATSSDASSFATWFDGAAYLHSGIYGSTEQITRTFYDNKYPSAIGTPELAPKNLRNRVAYTTYTDDYNPANYNAATFYSYDIHGNVDTLLQDYGQSITGIANIMNSNGSRWKRIVYKYDLISGKVNHVAYQPQYINSSGTLVISQDAFYHRYSYDAENRLTLVETSADSTVWEKDARYNYYKHGPLARNVIGQQQVQGIDYAYTIQGWLKGVNSTSLTTTWDMGNDGAASNNATKYIARDAYGFSLNYFAGDYAGINGTNTFAGYYAYLTGGNYKPLYNGNISSMAVNIGKFNDARFYNYKYDQLNRLKEMDSYTGVDTTTNTWSGLTISTQYKERISYDANGNILKYLRHGNNTGAIKMDSLTYQYNYSSGRLQNNKLNYVKDSVGASIYADDIDNQPSGNYTYDEIGNLISDSSENIRLSVGGIKWNVYGKIAEINKVDSTGSDPNNHGRIKRINYTYDAAGNRISKRVVKYATAVVDYTWYVRDASGNTMSVYSYSKDSTSSALTGGDLVQNEVYLYGSSRLGSLTVNRNVELTKQLADTTYSLSLGLGSALKLPFVRGIKQYELSNHLGNVLVTVSDKKIGHSSGGSTVDYYTADVITANDYYPFGMMQPGRKFSAGSSYRYGFNGQEKDKELNENTNTAQYWEYDARIGRRWNLDPVVKFYESPYACFNNNPVLFSDINGDDAGRRKHKETSTEKKPKILDGVVVVSKVKQLSKSPELKNDLSAAITRDLKALKITPDQLRDLILDKIEEKTLPPLPKRVTDAIKALKKIVEGVKEIKDMVENKGKTQFPSAYVIGLVVEALGGEGAWAAIAAKTVANDLDDVQRDIEETVITKANGDTYDQLNMLLDSYNGHYKDGFVRLWITREELVKIINDKAVMVETLKAVTYNGPYNGRQNLLYSYMVYIKKSEFVNPIIAIENIGYKPTGAKPNAPLKVK